jgi:hypothetical protein
MIGHFRACKRPTRSTAWVLGRPTTLSAQWRAIAFAKADQPGRLCAGRLVPGQDKRSASLSSSSHIPNFFSASTRVYKTHLFFLWLCFIVVVASRKQRLAWFTDGIAHGGVLVVLFWSNNGGGVMLLVVLRGCLLVRQRGWWLGHARALHGGGLHASKVNPNS